MNQKIEILSDAGLENLRYAIIKRAMKDYHSSLKTLRNRNARKNVYESEGNYSDASVLKNECERFFRSSWFGVLCDLDGEKIMSTIRVRFYNRPLRFSEDKKERRRSVCT